MNIHKQKSEIKLGKSEVFTEDIYKAIDLDTCVNTRTVPGGPSEAYIKSLIELNKKCIENLK